jgi:hypothetical protein
MPHLESELSRLSGSKFFATFDLSHGYWQVSLDEGSQAFQSFITPDGVYTPIRVLHGTNNAVPHMQASLQELLGPLYDNVLAWLDDLLLHTTSESELLSLLRLFLEICRSANLKLHPHKFSLFAVTARWCGRLLSAAGVKFDPRRIQGLRDMTVPTTGGELQQFTCALNWMRTAIPAFAQLVAPLKGLLEAVYSAAGNRLTKTAAENVLLADVGWGQAHVDVIDACKSALAHAATLVYPSPAKRLCLFTNASSDF